MKATRSKLQAVRGPRKRSRRGVAAVLAMMFLVLFGSLSAAMAIASKGNITTAATHLHVSRAQSAAETGLSIARARLGEAAGRFLIANSDVDGDFGWNFWTGNMSAIGTYRVTAPKTGRLDASDPGGLAEAIAQDHALDQNIVEEVGITIPTLGNALPDVESGVYRSTNWVYTPAVAIEPDPDGSTTPPLCYSITYAPLADGVHIRAIATGYDYAYTRSGRPITRTLMQDFKIVKRVKHAVISPSRIMVGKNVMIGGDLGCRYTSVTYTNGDPLVLRSDFRGIDATLDAKLDAFWASLAAADTDGDNRLLVGHPVESLGIPSGSTDYDGDGQADDAFADITEDGYVDEFDVFIRHFDSNGDGKIALSPALTAGTAADGEAPELVDSGGNALDDDLALLIDSSNPDRNRNGVWGYRDANRNGRWDSGETMYDFDSSNNVNRDQILGYRDGFIDKKDAYAKVQGSLTFKVAQGDWATNQGPIGERLRGSIAADEADSPLQFGASDDELPDVGAAIFSGAQTSLQAAADGAPFDQQVATQLGVSTTALATYVETKPDGTTQPRYFRLDPDANLDGLPDNWSTAYYEKMPFNSPNYSDFYYRPVYENMVFKDVQIPMGTNALFRNCTFVGVTWVRCHTQNTHVLWGEYGKMNVVTAGQRPVPAIARIIYGDDTGETSYPSGLPSTAVPPNQLIHMAQATPLDQADLPANVASITPGWADLSPALVINGRRVTDTKLYSNNLRFHDCLVVGSIVSDAPQGYTQSRNKMQFTGATKFVQSHPTSPLDSNLNPDDGDMDDIVTSSMMLPNYSVDVGSFNSPADQDLQLRGAIIAGVLDIRGNANIEGALLLTFTPVMGQAPLVDPLGNPIGNPAGFNTSIGYFGPNDGDAESLDPSTLPLVGGVKIVGYDVDGDGLADVLPDQPQPSGSTPVPFYGYGRISIRFDKNMNLPNGVLLPMGTEPVSSTYREGKP